MTYSRLLLTSLRRCTRITNSWIRHSSTTRPMYYDSVSRHTNNVALIDRSSSYTYGHLYSLSSRLSRRLLPLCRSQKSTDDSNSTNSSTQIAVLCPNDVSFIVAMWASWMIGATVVPLSAQHPPASISYFLSDAQCRAVVVGDERSHELMKTTFNDHMQKEIPVIGIDKNFLNHDSLNDDVRDDLILSTTNRDRNQNSNALIIYTSGTSGRPKGCVLTFDNLQAHVESMVNAWGWTKDDGKKIYIFHHRIHL